MTSQKFHSPTKIYYTFRICSIFNPSPSNFFPTIIFLLFKMCWTHNCCMTQNWYSLPYMKFHKILETFQKVVHSFERADYVASPKKLFFVVGYTFHRQPTFEEVFAVTNTRRIWNKKIRQLTIFSPFKLFYFAGIIGGEATPT